MRFQQVTGAYTLLKTLTPEELEAVTANRQQHITLKTAKLHEEETTAKIDAIIDKYEGELKKYYADMPGNDDADIKAIAFRLKSQNPKVINAALKHSGRSVNKVEIRKAITEILKRPEIDEDTANILASLPIDDMTRKLIALDVAYNAANFPVGLLISLAGSSSDVMESLLLHVRPDDVSVILRRWPSGKVMNANIIRALLMSDDARILVPLLGAMREHFPKSAQQHKKRLTDLEAHSSAAVRAWARKLTV